MFPRKFIYVYVLLTHPDFNFCAGIVHVCSWYLRRANSEGAFSEHIVCIPGVSTTLRFLVSFAKHIFSLGTFDTFWVISKSFHANKAFCLPSRCWLYTLSITKLNHVSVLFLSCVMLDQAPSHIIQTQAHN